MSGLPPSLDRLVADMEPRTVAVLFARKDSVYKMLPGCDVWDIERDVRNWPGGCPVIAHPPCGQWGRLRHLIPENVEEKQLGLLAAELVRKWGGALEQPAGSRLWDVAGLAKPSEEDGYGFTQVLDQLWFGHTATKRTWIYICGVRRCDVPSMLFSLGYPTRSIQTRQRHPKRLPELSRKGRESTPRLLAEWLCQVARLVQPVEEAV